MLACWSYALAVLILISAFLPSAVTNEECMLATMTCRHGDWPVDLEPPFRRDMFRYAVKLDFSMDYFAIDARPASGCEIAHAPPPRNKVQIGGSVVVTLYAKNPETGAKTAYTVTATRVLGSETELQFLTIVGGEFSPIFSPTHRTYSVRLDLKYDVAKVVYRLQDNEQRLRSKAQEEEPSAGVAIEPKASAKEGQKKKAATKSEKREGGTHEKEAGKEKEEKAEAEEGSERRILRGVALPAGNGTIERRLGATIKEPLRTSGEAQFRDAFESFMLDVGFKRKIILDVQSADATQANIGSYTLIVHRPGCTPERPYFEPKQRQCVNFCPAGFYRNEETHRCSKCNTNCRVCDTLLHCLSCIPDTAAYTYTAQPDGRCQPTVNHLYEKYRWWCIGLAVMLCFLVLIGCIGICLLCGCCCGDEQEKRGRKVHSAEESEDEEEEQQPPYASRRRLAGY
jgi:hypothetical protein